MNCFRSAKPRSFFNALRLATAIAFAITLVAPPHLYAQNVLNLPAPGTMVALSPAFTPTILLGLEVDPNNPFKFQFIVDRGDEVLNQEELKKESEKVIRYFLAGLAVPEDALWVNLSPYEGDRIVDDVFGQTEMGRDLLAQDYMLKQITASLIYPEDELGRAFWQRIYKKAFEAYGTTTVPMNTFNKVWIMPDKATVYEHQNRAIIIESEMKVMLEQDYVSLENNLFNTKIGLDKKQQTQTTKDVSTISSDVVREIVLPELRKEVNAGKNFTQLRQIYNSLILANWFKKNLKQAVLNKVYSDKNKVGGIVINDQNAIKEIYDQYLAAFKKGVCDYMKVEYDPYMKKQIPRKYFSGGAVMEMTLKAVGDEQGKEKAESGLTPISNKGRLNRIYTDVAGWMRGKAQKIPWVKASILAAKDQVLANKPEGGIAKALTTLVFVILLNSFVSAGQAANFNNDATDMYTELLNSGVDAGEMADLADKGSGEALPSTIELNGATLIAVPIPAAESHMTFAEYQVTDENNKTLGSVRFLKTAPNSKEIKYQFFTNDKEKVLIYNTEKGNGHWKVYRGGDPYVSTGRLPFSGNFTINSQSEFIEELGKVFLLERYLLADKDFPPEYMAAAKGVIAAARERILGVKSSGSGQEAKDPFKFQYDSATGEGFVQVQGEADTVYRYTGPQEFQIPDVPPIPPGEEEVMDILSLEGTGSLNDTTNVKGDPINEQIDFALALLDKLTKEDPEGIRIFNFDPLGEALSFEGFKGARTVKEMRALLVKAKEEKEAKIAKGEKRTRAKGLGNTDLLGRLWNFVKLVKSKKGHKNIFIVTDWKHDMERNKNAPWTMEQLVADGGWKTIAEELAANGATVYSVDVSESQDAPLRQLLEQWDNERVAKGERKVFYFEKGNYQGLLGSYMKMKEQKKEKEQKQKARQEAEEQSRSQVKLNIGKTSNPEVFEIVSNKNGTLATVNSEGQPLKIDTENFNLPAAIEEISVSQDDSGILVPGSSFKDLRNVTMMVSYQRQQDPFKAGEEITTVVGVDASGTTQVEFFQRMVQANKVLAQSGLIKLVGVVSFSDDVELYEGDHQVLSNDLDSIRPGNFTKGLDGTRKTLELAIKKKAKYALIEIDAQSNKGKSKDDFIDLVPQLLANGTKVIVIGDKVFQRHMNNYLDDIAKAGELPGPKDFLKGENFPDFKNIHRYEDIDARNFAGVLLSLAKATGGSVFCGEDAMSENIQAFYQSLESTSYFSQKEFKPSVLVVKGINQEGKEEIRTYKIKIEEGAEIFSPGKHITAEPVKKQDAGSTGSIIGEILEIGNGKGIVPFLNSDGSMVVFELSGKTASSTLETDTKASAPGGIDFQADQFNLKTKGEGIDMNVPFDESMLQNFNPDMIAPIIIQIVPITNPQMILGLSDQDPHTPS